MAENERYERSRVVSIVERYKDWYFYSSYTGLRFKSTELESRSWELNAQGGGYADAFGQMLNAGSVTWGGAEMGLRVIRHWDGAQLIGRTLGFGTQQTARALAGTLGAVSKVGKGLGVAGYGLQVASTGEKLLNGEKVGTAEAVGVGVSTVLIGAAWIAAGTAAAPFVAGAAIIYGAFELGSYMFTNQTVEEHIFGK